MFAIVSVFVCASIVVSAHAVDWANANNWTLAQIVIAQISVLGALSNGTQREKSALMIFSVWAAYILLTDWAVSYMPPIPASLESTILSAAILWALIRPYRFTSAKRNSKNVCIAFYNGNKAPFLSTLSSVLGLPFSSVSMIAGVAAMRPKNGIMTKYDPAVIDRANYVIVDTGVPVTNKIVSALWACEGKKTTIGPFRAGCVKSLSSALKAAGISPRHWYEFIPSIFYYRCMKGAT